MKKTIILTSLLLMIQLIFISCQTEEMNDSKTPIITSETTNENNEVTYTSIKISGKVTSNDENEISTHGICWSTNPNPTINDNKTTETTAKFSSIIKDLILNTKYYFRIYAIKNSIVSYSTEQTFSTLNLKNTIWKFSTYYPPSPNSTGLTIYSRIDFYENNTTRFDELDYPLQCPGCFITFGTWSLNGNTITYKWDSNKENNQTYVYTGVISGMTMSGSYTHPSFPGTWNAIPLK
jgi:hypothetical protein